MSDLGRPCLVDKRVASLDSACIASVPQHPYVYTTRGIHAQPSSLHLLSFTRCLQIRAAKAAEPAVTHAFWIICAFSVDVTNRSKAAGLPRTQFGTRTSAGRVRFLDHPPISSLRWEPPGEDRCRIRSAQTAQLTLSCPILLQDGRQAFKINPWLPFPKHHRTLWPEVYNTSPRHCKRSSPIIMILFSLINTIRFT